MNPSSAPISPRLPFLAVRWLTEQHTLGLRHPRSKVCFHRLTMALRVLFPAVRWFTEQHALELDGPPSVASIANLVIQVWILPSFAVPSPPGSTSARYNTRGGLGSAGPVSFQGFQCCPDGRHRLPTPVCKGAASRAESTPRHRHLSPGPSASGASASSPSLPTLLPFFHPNHVLTHLAALATRR